LSQRVIGRQRRHGKDVEAGAAQAAALQRFHQARVIDELAPRRVEKDGPRLHQAEARGVHEAAELGKEAKVKRKHIGGGEHVLERRGDGAHRRGTLGAVVARP
jgi:hypothetical protein